jgi:hypothetical protein
MTVPVGQPFRASIVVGAAGSPNQPPPGAGAGLLVGYSASSWTLRERGGRRPVDHTVIDRLLLRPDGEVRILRSTYQPALGDRAPRHAWGAPIARLPPGRAVRLQVAEEGRERIVTVDDAPPVALHLGEATSRSPGGRVGVVAIGLGIFRLRDIAFSPPPGR